MSIEDDGGMDKIPTYIAPHGERLLTSEEFFEI